MRSTRTLLVIATLTTLAAPALAGEYVSGGTFVAKTQFGTLFDDGGVVCDGDAGDGIGGGCLAFPTTGQRSGFVGVFDSTVGRAVAFQVCIDNNGDGICGGPQPDRCFDQIFFSHDDRGNFFNPLGPLPVGFLKDCPGGFPGYVVLLCEGLHETAGFNVHRHGVTGGSISLASEGSGYGDFCGGGGEGTALGNNPAVAKKYVVR